MELNDIFVIQYEAAFYALTFVFAVAPYFGKLELVGEILVKRVSRIFDRTADWEDNRGGEVGIVADSLCVYPHNLKQAEYRRLEVFQRIIFKN